MSDRNNGFADNWWGTFCRGIRDILNAFDVSAMSLAGILIVWTCVMATIELLTPDNYVTPAWWVGPTGVLFLAVVTLLGKHTIGYGIASKWNSPKGSPPELANGATDPNVPKAGG